MKGEGTKENLIVIDCFETSGQPLCKLLQTKGRLLREKRGHPSRKFSTSI